MQQLLLSNVASFYANKMMQPVARLQRGYLLGYEAVPDISPQQFTIAPSRGIVNSLGVQPHNPGVKLCVMFMVGIPQ